MLTAHEASHEVTKRQRRVRAAHVRRASACAGSHSRAAATRRSKCTNGRWISRHSLALLLLPPPPPLSVLVWQGRCRERACTGPIAKQKGGRPPARFFPFVSVGVLPDVCRHTPRIVKNSAEERVGAEKKPETRHVQPPQDAMLATDWPITAKTLFFFFSFGGCSPWSSSQREPEERDAKRRAWMRCERPRNSPVAAACTSIVLFPPPFGCSTHTGVVLPATLVLLTR